MDALYHALLGYWIARLPAILMISVARYVRCTGNIKLRNYPKRFYRQQAAAKYFSISVMTLWRWERLNGFPEPLRCGRVVLYDASAIEAWLVQGGERE